MNQVLFLSTKATRPSHRFRVVQMIPYLESVGIHCSMGFFPKNPVARFWFYRALRQFETIVIQQRLLNPIELGLVRRLSSRLVFDVDDSVMLNNRQQHLGRNRRRFEAMVRTADLVLCGNQFLRDRAASCLKGRHDKSLEVLPTAIDTERFRPNLAPPKLTNRVTIGWTGSRSSNRYLNELFPVLSRLPGQIELKIISDTTNGFDFSRLGSVPFRFVPWSAESEVVETAEFDIGLMPLPDDELTRGKCGCKALQYMALGIPAVCSSVGANCEIIQHGRNGYLACSDGGWIESLGRLVLDPFQRRSIGQAGRESVELKYSVSKISERLARLLRPHSTDIWQTASRAG